VVQLRETDLPGRDLLDLAVSLRAAIGDRATLLVNDRADVALAARADGVHLPERGLPVAAVRDVVGEGCLIGRSVHSVEAAVRGEQEGADFVQAGTIFETASKPGAPAAGLALVRDVVGAVSIPVLAIGGITADNACEVIEAGAGGVAVIGAIMDADDPLRAARVLRRAIDTARAE